MIDIRTVTEDEYEAYVAALETSFGGRLDEEELRRSRTVAEFGRGHAAFDDGRIVGAAEAATFSVTVPGGADITAAAVTAVGVVPTHRREGVARALMRAQLDDIHGRGESLALLYASEGGIYGRYGYGVATFDAAIEADTDHAAFVPGYVRSGRVRLAERSEALPLMHAVYDRFRASRPGAVGLSEPWWDLAFSDRPKDDPTFFALHDTDGTVDGFATYRVKHDWTDGVPQSELDVRHLLAVEPGAWADLWRYALDVDLIKRVVAHAMPADDPLFHSSRSHGGCAFGSATPCTRGSSTSPWHWLPGATPARAASSSRCATSSARGTTAGSPSSHPAGTPGARRRTSRPD